MKFCLDANALITPWNLHYQIKTFPRLWNQLARMRQNIILIKPVWEEIIPAPETESESEDGNKPPKRKQKEKGLHEWIPENGFSFTPVGQDIEYASLRLEQKYEIAPNSKGCSKTDITLIAYAQKYGHSVVTYESEQKNVPELRKNYKIPLVCRKENVTCMTFADMLQAMEIQV